RPLDRIFTVSSICTASSRVGARISARAVFGERLLPRPMILVRIGSARAAVLPEPVWATPSTSLPAREGGIAFSCTGFGTSTPAAAVVFRSGPVMPSFAKPVGSAVISLVNLFFFQAARRPQIPLAQGATCVGLLFFGTTRRRTKTVRTG